MGAGNPQGVKTNLDRVVEIIRENHEKMLDVDLDYTAQQICDALSVDPEGEFKDSNDD